MINTMIPLEKSRFLKVLDRYDLIQLIALCKSLQQEKIDYFSFERVENREKYMINLYKVIRMNIKESFDIYFDLVKNPRSQAHITYQLSDILFLLIVGMLCNCTDLEMIIEFTEEKEEFLKQYTELESIPCLSTISNILKIINPEHLELCLYGIFSNVLKFKMKVEEKQICIDGKTICSTATMKKHEKPMHIIAALLADESVSLGQITVESKSNEIPAVRELIELLDIKGAVLTMDAMHCQKETAEKLLSYTRKHWQVESFHWILDMNYNEDDSRVSNVNSQKCLNIIRKYCISIIKKYIENHNVKRKAIIANMRKCLLNEDFLIEVLAYYCSSL